MFLSLKYSNFLGDVCLMSSNRKSINKKQNMAQMAHELDAIHTGGKFLAFSMSKDDPKNSKSAESNHQVLKALQNINEGSTNNNVEPSLDTTDESSNQTQPLLNMINEV